MKRLKHISKMTGLIFIMGMGSYAMLQSTAIIYEKISGKQL